jgi:hypothetical protein
MNCINNLKIFTNVCLFSSAPCRDVSFSSQMPGFNAGATHGAHLFLKVSLGHSYLRVLTFPLPLVITHCCTVTATHIHIYIYHLASITAQVLTFSRTSEPIRFTVLQ